MKPIKVTLQPFVLVGSAVALATLFVLTGSSSATTSQLAPIQPRRLFQQALGFTITGPVAIEGVPTPQQMMRVMQGAPFTVPAGKLFVVTGLGAIGDRGDAAIYIANNRMAEANSDTPNPLSVPGASNSTSSIRPLPPGLTASAGEEVRVETNTTGGIVLGYLVDA